MGEAKARGDFVERRDQRLNEMVESAEILCAFRIDDTGNLRMETLARDEPPDQDSPAVGFVAYLNANWKQLAGEALALMSSVKGAEIAGRSDIGSDTIILPNGRAANEERDPVILGPSGGVISSADDDGPRIELPASVAQQDPDPVVSGGGGD